MESPDQELSYPEHPTWKHFAIESKQSTTSSCFSSTPAPQARVADIP